MRNVAALSKRLAALSARIVESMPPDPLAGMSPRERECIERYLMTVDPVERFISYLDGIDPVAIRNHRGLLPEEMTVEAAQEAYIKEIERR